LAGDLPVGTFALLQATIPVKATSVTVPFEFLSRDLKAATGRHNRSISLIAFSTDGGPVRLASTVIEATPRGSKRLHALQNGPDGIIASLPPGRFGLVVAGRPLETIQVAVRLTGDVNGDFRVNTQDLRLISGALGARVGQPKYNPAADVSRDGRIRLDDYRLARRNGSERTAIRPLSISGLGAAAADDPNHDNVVALSTIDIVGQTLPNTLVHLGGVNGSATLTTVSSNTGRFDFRNVPIASGTNSFVASDSSAFSQAASGRLVVTRVDTVNTAMTAQERMAAFGVTNIKGLCYTPEPSDDYQTTPANYFDSDFWNNAFTPMWSSQQNIAGFESNGGPVSGRGDLANMQSLGVNFLHIYNWNSQRDHTSFLATAKADGITVNVPISNYVFGLAMNPPFPPKTYATQLQYVAGIFNQVYPNLQSGNTSPNPDISMWTIGNEPDNSGGNITPGMVAQVAQFIVYLENQANIPDGNRLPIAVPLSWAISYVGTSYTNPTPSVGAVEALFNAFGNTAAITATDLSNAQVSVPALPSDFFTTRFVWANNPVGNDNAAFLGLETSPPYAPYNRPTGASGQIDWASIPMFFTEDGASATQAGNDPTIQAQIDKKQLADVQTARTNGQNPIFDGVCVFQSLDQLAAKAGSETGFGILTFQTGDFLTITDVPPTKGLLDGSPADNVMWRLDTFVQKPAYNVVKAAFNP
jgi:hypothetical protein